MGIKHLRSEVSSENLDTLSVPPGYVSLTSFKLKRVRGGEPSSNPVEDIDSYNEVNLKRPCRSCRPWILDDQIKHEQEESVSDKVDTVESKQLSRDAIQEFLEEAPVFYPTKEEFRDTLKYISTISRTASTYGMCSIVPPPSWSPLPTNLEASPFVAQVQWIGGLQNEHLQSKMTKVHENGCTKSDNYQVDSEHQFDTLETFKKYSDDFKGCYFWNRSQEHQEPSLEDIEAEYIEILQNCPEKIRVLHCDYLKSEMAIGFPSKTKLKNRSNCHCWNLNNTPRLSMSHLSFENSRTSELLVPRLKIGMCFSSSFWKVAEHHLYSLCYMHLGAPKIWYGVPGAYRDKFEAFLEKHIPNLSTLQPKLRDTLIANLSSSLFKSEDFPVVRCVQRPREFVLVFPGAYYSGFDTGFNCVEAVNVAPLDWLPYGQNIVELYSKQHRKTCRVKLETARREHLCTSSQSQKMDEHFDATEKKECCICFYDLHFSAAQCSCSSDRYSCLSHTKQLCSCPWSNRIFLFRYTINELNSLVEAMEGKVSAIYLCAKDILKLCSRVIVQNYLGGCASLRRNAAESERKSRHHARSPVNGSNVKSTWEKMKAPILARSTNQKLKHINELYKQSKETEHSTEVKQEAKKSTIHKQGTKESAKEKQSASFLAAVNLLACVADSSSESSSSSSSSGL